MANNYKSNLTQIVNELEDIHSTINNLPEADGGLDTSDATATADEIFKDKTAYTSNGKVTGTFTIDDELATQDNLITQIQSVVNNLPDAGNGSITLQDKAITPTTSSQTVTADSGYDGLSSVVIAGDANLVAENIVSGVSIFGVNGTFNGSSGGSGGDMETVTVTFPNMVDPMSYIYYIDGTVTFREESLRRGATFVVLKNSIFVTTDSAHQSLSYCTHIIGGTTYNAFLATG